jgi:hypothetical protein
MIVTRRVAASRVMNMLLAGIAMSCAGSPASADHPVEPSTLVITAVTPPAWVVRNGARTPLAPRTALQPGEILHTGSGGRVEGSLGRRGHLNLGADARLFVSDSGTATLRVLAGAFRISSRAAPAGAGWLVRLPGLSAGLGDAELWGRVTESHQHLILRRGEAVVRTDLGEALNMDRTYDRLDLGPASHPAAVARATSAEITRLLTETGFQPGAGTLTAGGRWRVTVLETPSEWRALAAYDRLRDAGYPALISQSERRSERVYCVAVTGMGTKAEAEAIATRLRSHPELEAGRLRISKGR